MAWVLSTAVAGALPRVRHESGRLVDPAGTEVTLFGVGYPAPFGIPYLNLTDGRFDPHLVIDYDLRAMRWLGLNCVRVLLHDAELMAADGNLTENRHLALLDYLIAAAAREGLYVILTPLSLSRGLDPVRLDGEEISLRATVGDAPAVVRDEAARRRVGRYLEALAARRNPFTGTTYGAEPAIAAIELLGRPLTGLTAAETTGAIDEWVGALRAGGSRQPVVCWVPHGTDAGVEAILASRADGISVSSYPAGFGAGFERQDDYLAPALADLGLSRPALAVRLRLCTEFDTADTPQGHALPAIAATLRAAGAAGACCWQWDTGVGAWLNNEWPGHWLHPAATPLRAAALAVAARVFAATPAGSPPPRGPEDFRGGPLRLETTPDTARWMDDTTLIHANSIGEAPPNSATLTRLLAVGSSRVAEFDGLGLYGLDRLGEGLWLLSVYPEPVVVGNPWDLRRWAAPGALEPIALPQPTARLLRLRLPDLGADFRAWWLRAGPNGAEPVLQQAAADGALLVRPGRALLTASAERPAVRAEVDAELPVLPAPDGPPLLEAALPPVAQANRPLLVAARAAGADDLVVELEVVRDGHSTRLPAVPPDAEIRSTRDVPARRELVGRLEATVPAALLEPGALTLRWIARDGLGQTARERAVTVGENLPFTLCEFGLDQAAPLFAGAPREVFGSYHVGGAEPQRVGLRLESDAFGERGSWLLRVPVGGPFVLRDYDAVQLRARANPVGTRLWIGLIEHDGATFGVTVEPAAEYGALSIPLDRFGYLSGGRRRAAPEITRLREIRLRCGAADQAGRGDPRRSVDLDDLALVVGGQ